MTHIEKAIKYIRENVDMEQVGYMIVQSKLQRMPVSFMYASFADDISDLLEEYGQDNDLPEGWWCEECDIDEIIERI
jgi:hypothetical protein